MDVIAMLDELRSELNRLDQVIAVLTGLARWNVLTEADVTKRRATATASTKPKRKKKRRASVGKVRKVRSRDLLLVRPGTA
jgi:hypothetical protein